MDTRAAAVLMRTKVRREFFISEIVVFILQFGKSALARAMRLWVADGDFVSMGQAALPQVCVPAFRAFGVVPTSAKVTFACCEIAR